MVKKKAVKTTVERFYFTVDDWCHSNQYGINRNPKAFPGNVLESNSIRIIGRLRNATKRKIDTAELHLNCMDRVEDRLSDKAVAVGMASVNKRHLECWALVPLIAFHSLPATLAAGKIQEVYVTVRNLRYNSGDTELFALSQELSDLEESEETARPLPETPASFSALD